MKKNYFKMVSLVFVFSLLTTTLFAQGPYVGVNVGYGFNMGSQNINGINDYIKKNDWRTYDQIDVSFGKGLNLGVAFGYMFNENIGLELGISYLIGAKTIANYKSSDEVRDYTLSSNMLRINPSLIIAAGFEKINPYAKVGMVIGSGSAMYEYYENDEGDIKTRKMKLNGGLAFGLSSAVGIMFNLSDKMSFFGELNMINLSYAPTKGELVEAYDEGIDLLPLMTVRDIKTEFVDGYTYNVNDATNYSIPKTELKERLPFGSFGVNIGFRFNL